MRKITLFILLLCSCIISSVFSEEIPRKLLPEEDPYRLWEQAKVAFDMGQYDDAIALAEQARLNRIISYKWSVYTLESAMQAPTVRAAGDNLSLIMELFRERDVIDAYTILVSLQEQKGKDFFNNSMTSVLSYLETTTVFPEVDMLIGRIYQTEGEYELAETYLTRAWETTYALDVPAMKNDILYILANLALIQGDLNKYEQSLLLILSEDPNFNGMLDNTFMVQTEKGLFIKSLLGALNRNVSIDKFFNLYRAESYQSLAACIGLSDLYLDKDETDKALSVSSLGAVLAVTRVFSIVQQRNSEFTYSSLDNLLQTGIAYADIRDWSIVKSLWKQLYLFANACSRAGYTAFSTAFYQTIVDCAPENYWRQVALQKLLVVEG